jgi:hypothetical protein
VADLYNDLAPWPTGRSHKRDGMIEELSRLNGEHCIYELWQNGRIEPCGKTIWTHENLCPDHKPFVESLSEYQYVRRTPEPDWAARFYSKSYMRRKP